jgi:hypothetical protein
MDGEHEDEKPLERVQSASITARVPDAVAAGVFATGAIVLQSPTEVMVDFVQGVANPRRIGVRVVMPPAVATQFAEALRVNLGIYEATFGRQPKEPEPVPPPGSAGTPREASEASEASTAGPRGEGGGAAAAEADRNEASRAASSAAHPPPIADAYDQLKATDDVLGGAYANTVTISHTGSEFHFDFINRCFPRSIVNARVYMAAPRAPALLESLKRSLRLG